MKDDLEHKFALQIAENKRLQNERIAAFTEYISDVKDGNFPDSSNLINMEEESLQKVIRAIEENR